MKALRNTIVIALGLLSASAFADTTLFNCSIPSQKNTAKLKINLIEDQSADFLTVDLVEKSGTTQFYNQMNKGDATLSVEKGFLQILALTEKSSQNDEGIVLNSGFLALFKGEDETFTGLLAAKGNIYPLSCTK